MNTPDHGSEALATVDPDRSGEFESKYGYRVSINATYWRLSKDTTVNPSRGEQRLHPNLSSSFRSALAFYAREYAPSTVNRVNELFREYLYSANTDKITVADLTNYRASLSKDEEHKLGSLRIFLRTWYELGYSGIQSEAIQALYGWRLKGFNKGRAVKSLDPKVGPLDDVELEALNTGAAQLFERENLTLEELAKVMLLTHLGARAIQISHLKIKDLVLGKDREGDAAYIVRLPLAKQREDKAAFRGTLKPKTVSKNLWDVLQLQAKQVATHAAKHVTPLSAPTVAELPLFPRLDAWPGSDQPISEADLLSQLKTDHLYTPIRTINAALRNTVRRGNIRGRDGELLQISSRRLRYTVGSRAARSGFGKWVIANLLDHKDTQNAGVYTDNHPNFTRVIDQAMGRALAPLAQAFMGTLVDTKSDARLGDDLRQQVTDGKNDIGVCGSYGYCGALAPVACYTCIHFQPLLDAPHGEVLQGLIEERERMKAYTNSGEDFVVGATDRTIIAVSQIIRLCEERQENDLRVESASGGADG